MSISEKLKTQVREYFNYRCAYCHSSQKYVLGWLEIEHIIPIAAGGTDDEENLCLACRFCNGYKKAKTHGRDPVSNASEALFNSHTQKWTEHFKWSDEGKEIIGITACGRVTVGDSKLDALDMLEDAKLTWISGALLAGDVILEPEKMPG